MHKVLLNYTSDEEASCQHIGLTEESRRSSPMIKRQKQLCADAMGLQHLASHKPLARLHKHVYVAALDKITCHRFIITVFALRRLVSLTASTSSHSHVIKFILLSIGQALSHIQNFYAMNTIKIC